MGNANAQDHTRSHEQQQFPILIRVYSKQCFSNVYQFTIVVDGIRLSLVACLKRHHPCGRPSPVRCGLFLMKTLHFNQMARPDFAHFMC